MPVSSSSHVSASPAVNLINEKEEQKTENLEGLVSVFAERLRISISHSPDGGVDYSHDIDMQNLIKKIHHLDPKIFETMTFETGENFILSREDAHTVLNFCNARLGINHEEFDPASTNATDLFTQVRADAMGKQNRKRTREEFETTEALNLSYHPTLEILQAIERLDTLKSASVKSRIEGNNDHLTLSADLVKFASRLRKDNKDSKGVDYSNDEEMKKEINKLNGVHPHIFGSVKKDEQGNFKSYKFSHEEVEAMKTSSGEQTQILMGRQNINKGYIENEMQEKNHLWELGHNIHRETSSLIEKINRNTSRG